MTNTVINQIFYSIKPLIPRSAQVGIRRRIAQKKRRKYAHIWPIDPTSANLPDGWPGWPDGRKFALVLSHDVDTRRGYNNIPKLAYLEEQQGFRSQFNLVPERYGEVEIGLLDHLKGRGFGIGVHGLKHDGKLFSSREIFHERALRINEYLRKWNSNLFTTPSMIRNHEWMHELNMEFCISTFDTDPFEPQSNGAGRIFPYWIRSESSDRGFLEFPYTLVQDFTLFILLCEKNINIWRQKLDWVASKGGMALLNSHPDYMSFGGSPGDFEQYPVEYYTHFLKYVESEYRNQYWHARIDEIADWWHSRVGKPVSHK